MGGIIRDLMCKGRLKRFQTTFVFRQDDRLSLVFYTETAPVCYNAQFHQPQYHTLKDKKWVFCKVKKS